MINTSQTIANFNCILILETFEPKIWHLELCFVSTRQPFTIYSCICVRGFELTQCHDTRTSAPQKALF